MQKFWMVWNYDGNQPRVKHETEASAIAEAERLARIVPGQRFVVLEAIELRQVSDMLRVSLRRPDDEIELAGLSRKKTAAHAA